MSRTNPAPTSCLAADDVDLLLYLATCAPSVHNSQPWSFTAVADGFELSADSARRLPVIDPDGRQAVISCGAALHHLVVAAEGLGKRAEVTLVPHGRGGPLAHVRLGAGTPAGQAQIARSVAILSRYTYRRRFADVPVDSRTIDELARAAESCSTMVRVIRPDELVEVEVLVSHAEAALQRDPEYARELRRWVWCDDAGSGRTDGIPASSTDHGPGRAEGLQGRAFNGMPLARPPVDEPARREMNTALPLSTTGDAIEDWLHAGMVLSAFLLDATARGLLAQPIGQVIDVPETRWALRAALGTIGVPQLLLRVGYGDGAPGTLRRPVQELLDRRMT